MKGILKLLVVLLLFLIPSSLNSSSFKDRIGIIFINEDGTYTLVSMNIDQSCDIWWQNNLVIEDRLDPKEHENLYVHYINGKPVIGNICNP